MVKHMECASLLAPCFAIKLRTDKAAASCRTPNTALEPMVSFVAVYRSIASFQEWCLASWALILLRAFS